MNSWQVRTSRYFYVIVGAIVLVVIYILLVNSHRTRQIEKSLNAYMGNLRDTIFMSTYDSLKKGNMTLFKNSIEEVGKFEDVHEFSLLGKDGVVHYSSQKALVESKGIDTQVVGLNSRKELQEGRVVTYYFPVETLNYCTRCHPSWEVGGINSYYKLILSRQALVTISEEEYFHNGLIVAGGSIFLIFIYLMFVFYERKKHEEQMFLSASAFDTSVEAMTITTYEGLVQKINSSFSRITGYSEEEILGKDIHVLDAGERNSDAYKEMRRKVKEDGTWSGEFWNRRKDGSIFPVRLSVTAVKNIKNRITHFISIFYDVTAENEAKHSLMKMDIVKSEFISTAAHELRTPLSAMMGFTELVRDPEKFGGFTIEQKNDFLDEVIDRGEALNQIIDDLLDISRIESGQSVSLCFDDVNVVAVLKKAVEFHKIQDSGHRFILDVSEIGAAAICVMDRYRINQVIENLLSNAAKYSAKGSEIVVTGVEEEFSFKISVTDSGVGMTPEQVEKVFDKFYRADSSNTAVGGLGLGMSIAKQIVVAHGGEILVSSTKGEGTIVTICLPKSH